MEQRHEFTPQSLTRYTEALRRELYDAVVWHIWTPRDPGDYVPTYTPDAAQLTVTYMHGRWIVAWTDLEEEAEASPDQRAVMSRILASPDSPSGIMLSEI
jgi:hypothetical protein